MSRFGLPQMLVVIVLLLGVQQLQAQGVDTPQDTPDRVQQAWEAEQAGDENKQALLSAIASLKKRLQDRINASVAFRLNNPDLIFADQGIVNPYREPQLQLEQDLIRLQHLRDAITKASATITIVKNNVEQFAKRTQMIFIWLDWRISPQRQNAFSVFLKSGAERIAITLDQLLKNQLPAIHSRIEKTTSVGTAMRAAADQMDQKIAEFKRLATKAEVEILSARIKSLERLEGKLR